MHRPIPRTAALVLLAALVATSAPAAPSVVTATAATRPGPATARTQETGDDIYAAWARVLAQHVDAEGLVDYRRLKDGPGRRDLEAFMDILAATDPSSLGGEDARKAFWINAYNAVVIWQVVQRYPIDSVRDVGVLWGLIGGFFKQGYPVAGARMSADDIEHQTLRARWPEDAEIHWALVCAAFGCPRLLPEPYRAADLDATLEARGREFLARPRGLQADRRQGVLYLSSYFDWYADDFERVAGSVLDYVAELAPEQDAAWIRAERDRIEVRIMPYDWTLNDQANGPRSARPVQRQ